MSMLSVEQGHRLYYAEFGNPQGIPLLFIHGGPGSGCNPAQAQLIYPEGFRIIQLDQRGCGQSTPLASLEANTTAHLITDMEALGQHLKIEQWAIYGGSWGTVLALEYAKQFPEKVLGILLRGVFLARREDWEWFALPQGVAHYFPEAYRSLLAALGVSNGEDPARRLAAHLQADAETAYRAALAWDTWESTVMRVGVSSFNPDPTTGGSRIARSRIYAHYAINQFFLPEQGVLVGLDKLSNIPVYAVHGQQDWVCRLTGAEVLRKHLKHYELLVVEAGHGMHETNLQQGLQQLAQALYFKLPRYYQNKTL